MSQDFRARQTQTSQVISSGSSGTGAKIVFYDVAAQSSISPNQGIIDSTKFGTSSIGTDIFLYVSGGIGQRDVGNSQAITVFGGDVFVSGNLAIAGYGNVSTNLFRLTVADYATTTNTSSNPEVVGQAIFDGTQFSGSLTLRAIVNSALSGAIAVIKLYELNSASYVDIRGVGQQELAVTGTTPTVVESVNLYNANGFLVDGQGKYELRLFTATSGVAAFVGGAELKPSGTFTNHTIVTQSFTTTFISGTTGFRLEVLDYATTSKTSSNPEVVGQVIFPANQFSGSLVFRTVLSVTNATATGSVRLFNVTSGAYVHLQPSQTILSTSNTTPTILTSQNLYGAVNFTTGSEAIYEMHLHTSTGSISVVGGGAELRPSGSFTGQTIISASSFYSSGTWIDDNNRLRTTASVAINTDGLFANQYGSDVYFYVSGTLTSGSSSDRISVFGGSVRVSGVLAVGPGTTFISGSTIGFTNVDPNTGAIFRVDNITDGSAIVGSEASLSIASSTVTVSGAGGDLSLAAGDGGYTHAINGKHPGGGINLDAGSGGTIAGGGSNSGAGGGAVTIVGGAGGNSLVGARVAGAGGNINMSAGDGGQNLAVIGDGGDGGSVFISAGGGSAGVTSYGDGGRVEIAAGNTFGVSGSPGSIRLLPGVNTFDSIPGYVVIASSYNDERVRDAFLYISGTIATGSATSRNTVFQGSIITSGTLGLRNPQFPPAYAYISVDSSGDMYLFDTNNPGGQSLTSLVGGGSGTNFWTVSGTFITTSSSLALKTPNSVFQYTSSLFIAPVSGGGINSASLGVRIYGGDGAFVNDVSHTQKNGGTIELYTGTGSNTANPIAAGHGGDFRLVVGKGGDSGTGFGGNGGNVIITAGTGGNSTNTAAGIGGSFQLIAGDGGTGFGPANGGGFELITGRSILGGDGVGNRGGSFTFRLANGGDPTTASGRAGDFIVSGGGDFSSKASFETFRNVTFGSPNAAVPGVDVFFYVSGTFGSGSSSSRIAAFGGDVKITGTLAVGTGSTYIKNDSIFFNSASIQNIGGQLRFFDSNNLSGETLSNLVGGGSSFFYSDTVNVVKHSGSLEMTGSGLFKSGLTGALNRLPDGSHFLLAGANIVLSTGSNGAITIAAVTGSAGAAGSTNEIQYNLAGALTASNNFWIDPGVSVNVTGAMNVSGNLSVGGGVKYNPTFVTASRTIVTTEYIVGVSASAALTLTLPTSPSNGQAFIVKDVAGNAVTNNIIVSSSGPQIDGASTYTLSINYGSAQIVYFSNPAMWGVI